MTLLEKNFRFYVGTTIGNSQLLFWVNKYRKRYIERLISKETDVCIEGFHRSGNSFFVMLFKQKNKELKVAHHTHAAAQIIKAIHLKKPTIVLIREPEDAIASLMVWDENLAIGNALRAWISFYKRLIPYRSKFLIVTFAEVTLNPVKVVLDLNDRCGTTFNLPEFKEQQLEKIKSRVKARNNALSAPLPTAEKEEAKLKFKDTILEHKLYSKAQKLYEEFVSS